MRWRAVAMPLSRLDSYVARATGSVRSMAFESTNWVWPNLIVPADAWARLNRTMSSRVRIGAVAGSRARYAFRSRLNSYARMLGGNGVVTSTVTGTTVAPCAWRAATAWVNAAPGLPAGVAVTPIRAPCRAVGDRAFV